MIKIKAVKDTYQDCRNYVMQEARTLEEKELRRKDQKSSGGQDGLCNGMHDGDDHGKGGKPEGEYPPMDALGGKPGGGKWGGKGGGKNQWGGAKIGIMEKEEAE